MVAQFLYNLNFGEIMLVLISSITTTIIIFFWMKVFHKPPSPSHAFGVALIANLQNYFVPFLGFFLAIPYAFQLLPALIWIFLLRIFYSDLNFKHTIIIGLLCFGTHSLLETYGLAVTIQNMFFRF